MRAGSSFLGRAVLLVLAAGALGCGGSTVDPDAGAPDAGHDAGPADGGPEPLPPPDCTEPVSADVFVPPANLPPLTADERGRLLRCGTDAPISAATADERARRPFRLEEDAPDNYDGETLTHGATVIRVLYRSERRNGGDGFSRGTLYLPDSGASNLPLAVHVSGTTGLADECAPSSGNRFRDLERTLYLLVGRGHAVFVPDLMGLGTPGTLAWLEGTEAGRSVLDGARAALAAAPEGALSGEITISGHSAGGHAALAAQALQRSYAPELNVLGVSAIGAVWFDTAVFGQLLGIPSWSTAGDDGWVAVYGAMYFIGHTAAYDGEARAYDPISATRREAVRSHFETYCLDPQEPDGTDIRMAIAMEAATVGDLFESAFRSMIGRIPYCGTPVGCPPEAETWRERFRADRPALDPEGAPVWFHQGELDARSTTESMGCPIAAARHSGVDTSTCFYTGFEHGPLAGAIAPWLSDWITALGAGQPAPACSDPEPFPEPSPEDCGL